MKTNPKTIQIFLPSGDPQGIQIAEITTRIVQVIEMPRSLLGEFFSMPECSQVALYFLFGQTAEGGESVYIGQTGDLKTRLTAHHQNKEFWQKALVVISRTNSLTQTHVAYLEWLCIKHCRDTGRYADENGNAGNRPYTPAPLQADCMEVFDTVSVLLSTLGYPIFEKLTKTADDKEGITRELYCTRNGVQGRGQYTSEGFVVLKGSTGNLRLAPSMKNSAIQRKREQLFKTNGYRIEGNKIVLERDYLFNSPSMAAGFLVGNASNGWIYWKDANGHTLDKLERQGESQENSRDTSLEIKRKNNLANNRGEKLIVDEH